MNQSQLNALRDEIERQTQEFLANGGRIQILPAPWDMAPAPEEGADDEWIDTRKAAAALGMDRNSLLALKAKGFAIPKYRAEGRSRLMWHRPSVEAFAERRKRRAA